MMSETCQLNKMGSESERRSVFTFLTWPRENLKSHAWLVFYPVGLCCPDLHPSLLLRLQTPIRPARSPLGALPHLELTLPFRSIPEMSQSPPYGPAPSLTALQTSKA